MNGKLSLPSDILGLLRFAIDFKNRAKFSIRTDSGIDYVVNYTDAGYSASQALASKQPKLTSEGIEFDGLDDLLQTNDLGNIVYCCVVANHNVAFTPYAPFVSGYQGGVPYPSIMGQIGTAMFEGNVSPYSQSDIRMNNIPSSDFAPISQYKVVSAKFGLKLSNVYDIGSNIGNGAMNGTIKGGYFFHTEPTESQKTVLQQFLETHFNL